MFTEITEKEIQSKRVWDREKDIDRQRQRESLRQRELNRKVWHFPFAFLNIFICLQLNHSVRWFLNICKYIIQQYRLEIRLSYIFLVKYKYLQHLYLLLAICTFYGTYLIFLLCLFLNESYGYIAVSMIDISLKA